MFRAASDAGPVRSSGRDRQPRRCSPPAGDRQSSRTQATAFNHDDEPPHALTNRLCTNALLQSKVGRMIDDGVASVLLLAVPAGAIDNHLLKLCKLDGSRGVACYGSAFCNHREI